MGRRAIVTSEDQIWAAAPTCACYSINGERYIEIAGKLHRLSLVRVREAVDA